MTQTSHPDREAPACRVAIVGAGYMAGEHIRAFQHVPGAEVVGIHSRTAARAGALAAELGVPRVYPRIDMMFGEAAPHLVVIAVPELQANEVCCACFEHPWTLLLEKPAGYNMDDALAIAGAARAQGRAAYVALNRRHYSSTRAVIDDLKTSEGPRLIKVQDQEDTVAALAAGQPPLVVDNWMYANSIHVIDYFLTLGRGQVTGVERVVPWQRKTGYVVAKVSFESGDVGLYEAIWNGPGPWAVAVNTPEKRWEMRPLERASFQLAGTRVLQPVEPDPIDVEFKAGLVRQAQLAVRAALGEAPAELPTVEDALASMRLTQAIYA